VRQRDMMFGTHHDAPVAFPDSMRVLAATVTRRTRSGDILGPDQRVDVMTALKAMTIWPAWQHFEEDEKGTIEVGKRADFVILSDDPTAIDAEALADIDVLTTIKDGAVIYEAEMDESRLRYRPERDGADPFADFLRRAAVASDVPTDATPLHRRFAVQAGTKPHSPACLVGFLYRALAREANS
jgi:hypothetical protein